MAHITSTSGAARPALRREIGYASGAETEGGGDGAVLDNLNDLRRDIAALNEGLKEAHRRSRFLEVLIEDVRWQLYLKDSRRLSARFKPKLFILRQYPARTLRVGTAPPAISDRAPSIALVTPVYNQARFIKRTLDSVAAQAYPRLAYAVQDGGSTDGTAELVAARGAELTAWESGPDRGQTDAINRGFARIDGEIMGWLNGDDMLMPGALAFVGRFFRDNPDVDMIYGHRLVVDADDGQIGHWILPPHDAAALNWADFVPQETMFWRRRVWDAVGPLDESFAFAMDWDFLLRAQAAGFRLRRVSRFLGCFRVHDAQKTGNQNDLYQEEAARLRLRSLGRRVSDLEIHEALRPYMFRHVLFERLYKLKLLRC